MKVSELRLGNLVNWGVNIVPVKSIHTESVLKNEVRVYIELNEKLQNYCLDITEIEPIPLTKEWLLKFGFKEHAISYYNLNDIIISYANTGLHEYRVRDVNVIIKYVHQLQNLYFALTGEELILNA